LERTENAHTETDLRPILEEARARGWLRETAPLHPAKRAEKDPFEGHRIRVHLSPDGYQVLVGENAEANDYLLTRVARPNDWWLHVRAGTGAHVIIRTNNQPERALHPRKDARRAPQRAVAPYRYSGPYAWHARKSALSDSVVPNMPHWCGRKMRSEGTLCIATGMHNIEQSVMSACPICP
jgi:hypothetical protein